MMSVLRSGGFWARFMIVGLFAVLNVACFGSSSSGTTSTTDTSSTDTTVTRGETDVAALTISNQVTLTTAQDSVVAGSRSSRFLKSFLSALDDSEGTDYANFQTNVYSYHNSQRALDMANEIMCSFDQTRYYDFVNQGPYVALVDTEKCSKDQDHSSDSDDQSSAESTALERWVIDVIRTDADSPQEVHAWIDVPSDDGDHDMFTGIEAKIYIEEAATEENPLGIFQANFKGTDDDDTVVMTGILAVDENADGETTIQMSFEEASGAFSMAANAVVDPSADTGRAYTRQSFAAFGEGSSGEGETGTAASENAGEVFDEISLVAYDAQHYRTLQTLGFNDTEASSCLSRSEYDEFAWGYALFNEDGSMLERRSGMSLKPVDSSDEGFNFCWAGYYGTWCPEEAGVENGSELEDDDGNAYTLFQGQGRLIREEKQTLTLAELEGDQFHFWDQTDGQNYFVEYADGTLTKVAKDECNETGCQVVEITPVAVTLEPYQWLGLWKDGLGHLDITASEAGTLSDDMEVPYYISTFISPDDVDGTLELKCFTGCPKGGLSADDVNAGEPFLEDQWDTGSDGYIYEFDPATYAMTYGGDDVSIDSSEAEDIDEFASFAWGVMSGRMVPSSVELENPWEVWQQDVTYTWETGPNDWNHYQGLRDSGGAFVVFDRPLKCEYQSDEYGTFFLDYQGEGQLNGIPWTQIEDESVEWSVWRPQFSLANGTELRCEGENKYVKARDVEQNMRAVSASECASLDLPEDLEDPDLDYEDPDLDAEPTEYNGVPLTVRVTSGAVVE